MKNPLSFRRLILFLTLLACCAGGGHMSTTYNGTANNINYPNPLSIASSTAANPAVVKTSTPHGLVTGDYVLIKQHQTNYNVNGLFPVTVPFGSTTTFSVPVTGLFAGGATGTVQPITFGTSTTSPSDGDNEDVASVNPSIQTALDRTVGLLYGMPTFKLATFKAIVANGNLATGGNWAAITDATPNTFEVIPSTGTSTPVVTLPLKIPGIQVGDYIDVHLSTSGTLALGAFSTNTSTVLSPLILHAGQIASATEWGAASGAISPQPLGIEKFAADVVPLSLNLPPLLQGTTLSSVSLYFSVGNTHGGGIAGITFPSLTIQRFPLAGGSAPETGVYLSSSNVQTFPTPASGSAWHASGNQQLLTYTCNQNNVLDFTQYVYVMTLVDENGGSAQANNIYLGMSTTTTTPVADNAIELSIGYDVVDDPIVPTYVKLPGSGQMIPPGAQTFFPVNLHGFVQSTQEGSLYVQPGITSDITAILALYGNVTMTVNILRSTGIVGD